MLRISVVLLTAAAAHAATLENAQVRVVFNDTTGAITSFTDKLTNRDFIRPESAALYELTFLDEVRTRIRFTERDATAKINPQPGVITITSTIPPKNITAIVNCTLNQTALRCGLKIVNNSILTLTAIRFPAIEFPVRLGDNAEDDRLLVPRCDGAIIENPELNLQGSSTHNYPGGASLQLLAFYDATAGIRAITLDGAGLRKSLGVNRRGPGLSLQLIHYPELASTKAYTLPYEVELATFHGDWETAATAYREWAVTQPWCRRTLQQRIAELPQWLRDMPFFYTMAARGINAENKQAIRYDMVAQQTAEYTKLLKAPAVAMFMSWEKQGPWVTPDYLPPAGPPDAFKNALAEVKKQGNHSLIFLSGLKWTLRKGADYDSTEAFARDGEPSAIVAEDGGTLKVGKPTDDTGQYAELCPATRFASDLLSTLSRELTNLGVTAVQVDQMVGGGGPICYSTKHGHPAGGGKWQAEAVYKLFERLRSEGKERSRDFAFLIEEPGEMFIPVLDAYHARDYAEGRWPRDGRGVRGVPLFTYIYHDYLLGYGGDSAGVSKDANAQNIYSAAANLVNGKIAAAAVWGRNQPPAEVHPAQRELLTSALAMARGPAHEFLLYGKRLPTPKLQTPDVKIPIWVQSAAKGEDRAFPAIVQALYQLPDGRKGWIAVNVSNAPVEVKPGINLDPGQPIFIDNPKPYFF